MTNIESFAKLGIGKEILAVLEEKGFEVPTEIQKKAIPIALQGKDIIGGSATGSGKTLAFGASILEKTEKGKGIQTLILTPTRELAEQVACSLSIFSKHKPLKITPIYGGMALFPQFQALKKTDIVIGTPGRILDHLSRKTIDLSKVKYLVLDEADRMLDMGFLPDVERIIKTCPKKRQTFLFSATISGGVLHIAKRHMNHPLEISVESKVDPSKLEQIYYDVPSNEKFSLLVHLLKKEKSGLVMVFSNTKRNADFLSNNLNKNKINAMALHGDLSQNKRKSILEQFHKSESLVLVCTDIAARGLDIKNVSHVYNYDSPKDSTDYIHRIGRTARAGEEGKAITLISSQDYKSFQNVNADPSIKIKNQETPKFEILHLSIEPRRRFSNRPFRRGNSNSGDRRSPRSNSRNSSRSNSYSRNRR